MLAWSDPNKIQAKLKTTIALVIFKILKFYKLDAERKVKSI